MGCPRSGTTILQRALANHPRATSFPEIGYFRQLGGNRIWTRVAEYGVVRPVQVSRAKDRLREVLGDELTDNNLPTARSWSTRDAADRFRAVIDKIALSRAGEFWVEKTPKQYQTAEILRRFMQPCVVIHVIRNGEDVLGSIRHRSLHYPERFGAEYKPYYGVHEWNKAIRAAWRQHRSSGVWVVEYDSFVADPARVLSRIMEEIGESYYAQMVRPSSLEGMSNNFEQWKSGANGPIAQPESKFDRLFECDEKSWIRGNLESGLFYRLKEVAL